MRHTRSQRRGISMMMVTAVVAVASVMGMALLASTSLQSAATRNQDQVVVADGLAESGINVGMYWVQNLGGDAAKCPAAVTDLAVGGSVTQTGVKIKGVQGAFDVTVDRLSSTRYQVSARGRSNPGVGATTPGVRRPLAAQAEANYFGYGISATNLTTSSFTIPAGTVVDGDVFANVPVTVASGATVNGTVYAGPPPSGGGGGGLLGGLLGGVLNIVGGLVDALTGIVATLVPGPDTVNHYTATYTLDDPQYAGQTFNAQQITVSTLTSTTALTNNAATNPARVFYRSGDLTLSGPVKLNGTLIVKGGALTIRGSGNAIAQSATNLPALVVDDDIIFDGTDATLDVRGLAYAGDRVTTSGTSGAGRAFNVTGALLFGGQSARIGSGIATHVTYDRVRASVPSLVTNAKPMPTSITVVSWKN